MQLLPESNCIFEFVDGSHPCPTSSDDFGTNASNSPSSCATKCDDMLVWKMHDRTVM